MGDYRWLSVSTPTQPELEITIQSVGGGPGTSEEDRTAIDTLLAKGLMSPLIFSCDDVDALFEHVQASGVPRCSRSRPTSSTACATARSATRRATCCASRPRCRAADHQSFGRIGGSGALVDSRLWYLRAESSELSGYLGQDVCWLIRQEQHVARGDS